MSAAEAFNDIDDSEIIAWCFDEIEKPEWWADPQGTKAMLAELVRDFQGQFAARKADYLAATEQRLHTAEFKAVRSDYENWKRRATHIQAAVIDRLQQVRTEIVRQTDAEREAIGHAPLGADKVERLLGRAKVLRKTLDQFIAEFEALAEEAGG